MSYDQVPSIIFIYPFEKGIRSINNLCHGRKIAPSIARIATIIISIGISIGLPQIPQVSIYLIGFISASVGIQGLAAMTLGTFALGVILTAVNIAMVSKFFDAYYKHKYGHPNPEYRLTRRDRKLYSKLYAELSREELEDLLKSVDKKIKHLVLNIERNKDQGRKDKVFSLKHVLYKLKQGDLETYNKYYEEENYKRNLNIINLKRALNSLGKDIPDDFINSDKDSLDLFMARERELSLINSSTWQTEGLVNGSSSFASLPDDPIKACKRILRMWETKKHSFEKCNDPEELRAIIKDELSYQIDRKKELENIAL